MNLPRENRRGSKLYVRHRNVFVLRNKRAMNEAGCFLLPSARSTDLISCSGFGSGCSFCLRWPPIDQGIRNTHKWRSHFPRRSRSIRSYLKKFNWFCKMLTSTSYKIWTKKARTPPPWTNRQWSASILILCAANSPARPIDRPITKNCHLRERQIDRTRPSELDTVSLWSLHFLSQEPGANGRVPACMNKELKSSGPAGEREKTRAKKPTIMRAPPTKQATD